MSGSWVCCCLRWKQLEESQLQPPWCWMLAFGGHFIALSAPDVEVEGLVGLPGGVFLSGTFYQVPLRCF